jgi:hypothetical protein
MKHLSPIGVCLSLGNWADYASNKLQTNLTISLLHLNLQRSSNPDRMEAGLTGVRETMWISVRCGCGGSNVHCSHCAGHGFTWRISISELQADTSNHCNEWMICTLCSVRIHRGRFLAHLEISHRTTWDAVERFITSTISSSPEERSAQQPVVHRLFANSLRTRWDELNLAMAHLIPRHKLLRLARNLSSPERRMQDDKAETRIVLDFLLP